MKKLIFLSCIFILNGCDHPLWDAHVEQFHCKVTDVHKYTESMETVEKVQTETLLEWECDDGIYYRLQ